MIWWCYWLLWNAVIYHQCSIHIYKKKFNTWGYLLPEKCIHTYIYIHFYNPLFRFFSSFWLGALVSHTHNKIREKRRWRREREREREKRNGNNGRKNWQTQKSWAQRYTLAFLYISLCHAVWELNGEWTPSAFCSVHSSEASDSEQEEEEIQNRSILAHPPPQNNNNKKREKSVQLPPYFE